MNSSLYTIIFQPCKWKWHVKLICQKCKMHWKCWFVLFFRLSGKRTGLKVDFAWTFEGRMVKPGKRRRWWWWCITTKKAKVMMIKLSVGCFSIITICVHCDQDKNSKHRLRAECSRFFAHLWQLHMHSLQVILLKELPCLFLRNI